MAQVAEFGKSAYWTLGDSDNEGHTTFETFGNGVTTTRGYYLDKGAVHTIVTSGHAALQDLSYIWDDRLNLHVRNDSLQTTYQKETFQYDTSDRMSCASFTGSCSLRVDYDASGNITNKTGVGNYTYTDTHHPHAVTTAGSGAYTYDAVGNQTVRPDGHISYNAANLPTQIVPNTGVTSNYLYDGLEDRIQKQSSTDTTVYAGGLFERVSHSDGTKDYYYSITSEDRVVAILNRHVVGTTTSSSTSYIHTDHLGSPDVITNDTGAWSGARSFDAFGKPRQTDWSKTTTPAAPSLLPVAYSGQENDNLGLVDMKGRTYDPRLGRMLQADPYVIHPGNVQGWNRYAYVENNPLRYVDPSGFDPSPTDGPPLVSGTMGPNGGPTTPGSPTPGPYAGDNGLPSSPPTVGNGQDAQTAPTNDTAPTGTSPLPPERGLSMINVSWPGGPTAVDTSNPDLMSTGAGGFNSGDDVYRNIHGHVDNYNGPYIANLVGNIAITGMLGGAAGLAWGPTVAFVRTIPTSGWLFFMMSMGDEAEQEVPEAEHIAIGFEHVVEEQAESVGATHLIQDPNWKDTFLKALGSTTSRFTVFVDHMAGDGAYGKVMTSVTRTATNIGGATDWEITQLYQTGRLGEVTFMENGVVIPNPFQ